MPSPDQQILVRKPIDNATMDNATIGPLLSPLPLTPLQDMARNRDLWAKVAAERLLEIGKLKEKLDAMRRERNEALAEVTVARAVGGESASGEIPRLKAELVRAVEERDELRAELESAKRDRDEYLELRNDALIANQPLREESEKAGKEIERFKAEVDTLKAEVLRVKGVLSSWEDVVGIKSDSIRKLNAERERLTAELDEARSQRDIAVADRDIAVAEHDSIVAELANLHEFAAEQVRVLATRNVGESSEVERLKAERDRAESCLGRSIAERNEAFAERDKMFAMREAALADRDAARSQRDTEAAEVSRLKVDLSVAITERNQARSEREKITAAFEAYVALDEDEDWEDLPTDEELDACDVDEDDEGDPDSDDLGSDNMVSDRVDMIGNALFNLGGNVDRQAGRIDAVTEAVRGLTSRFEGHEEGANLRIADAETNINYIFKLVESLFRKVRPPETRRTPSVGGSSPMRFNVRSSPIPQQDGDYETVGDLGGYCHFPDRSMRKAGIAHLVDWLTEATATEYVPGIIRLEDGREWMLIPENRDAILEALGFPDGFPAHWQSDRDTDAPVR